MEVFNYMRPVPHRSIPTSLALTPGAVEAYGSTPYGVSLPCLGSLGTSSFQIRASQALSFSAWGYVAYLHVWYMLLFWNSICTLMTGLESSGPGIWMG
jgi:hypothetical protein